LQFIYRYLMKKLFSILFLFLFYNSIFAQGSDIDQKLYQGVIKDSATGKLFRDGLIEVFNTDPKLADFSGKVNNESGEYSILMRSATKYLVRITSPYILTKEFYFESARGIYEDIKMDILVNLVPVGQVLFEGNMFKSGTNEIIAANKLDEIVRYMDTTKAIVIAFSVWADNNDVQLKKMPIQNTEEPTKVNIEQPKKTKTKGKAKNKVAEVTQEVQVSTPVVVAQEPITTPVSEQANEEKNKQLVSERCIAIRDYFKLHKISTTRIEFDKNGKSPNSNNAKISIKMIRLEKDDD